MLPTISFFYEDESAEDVVLDSYDPEKAHATAADIVAVLEARGVMPGMAPPV